MDPGMADPGFPDAHTTTTKTHVTTSIRFDPLYFRSIPGLLKCAQILFNLIGYICIAVSAASDHSRANWFGFVSMTGFWVTGILLVAYVMHVLEKFFMIPWLMLEFGYTALWTFFYLTASCAVAAWGGTYEAWAAAAFFGFVAMFLYGVDAFFKFKGWRSGEIAQGLQTVQMGAGNLQSPAAY